jgi:uncharacterized protein YndB with AHSA1/START domain
MHQYVDRVAADTVRLERLLPGPLERAWSFLTESDKRARWLAGGEWELRPACSPNPRPRSIATCR